MCGVNSPDLAAEPFIPSKHFRLVSDTNELGIISAAALQVVRIQLTSQRLAPKFVVPSFARYTSRAVNKD